MRAIIRKALLVSAAAVPPALLPIGGPAYAQTATRSYSIPAQDLGDALRQFGTQSGRDVVFDPAIAAGKTSKAVQGAMSDEAALRQLTSGSGLRYKTTSSGFAVTSGNAVAGGPNAGNNNPDPSSGEDVAQSDKGIAEILVVGKKTQNVDIRRTENDAQPYTIFSKERITNSGAQNVEQFLLTQLSSNAMNRPFANLGISAGGGGVDLHGLGPDETLILVDGRRRPSYAEGGTYSQSSLNGIPLTAIERIEVLANSASGIYGSNAMGGVINIILKRDYRGIDLHLEYGNTLKGDAHTTRLDISGSLSFNKATTHLTFAASKSEYGQLLNSERDFSDRAARLLRRTNPSAFFLNARGFVCSTTDFFPSLNSCNGPGLVLDDGTSLGSNITTVPRGYLGPASDGGAALAANAGLIDFSYSPTALWQPSSARSASVNLSQDLGAAVKVYVDTSREETRVSSLQAQTGTIIIRGDSPYNPFQQDIAVNVPLPTALLRSSSKLAVTTISSGAIVKLPRNWSVNLEHHWTQSRAKSSAMSASALFVSPSAQAALESAALRDALAIPIPDAQRFLNLSGGATTPNRFSSSALSARLGGPVVKLPAGIATLTIALESREEKAKSVLYSSTSTFSDTGLEFSSYNWVPSSGRKIKSIYGETRVPIFGETNAKWFVSLLDITVAGRYDSYSSKFAGAFIPVESPDSQFPTPKLTRTDFHSANYTLALRYAPTKDVMFRGSHSTGFVPPQLSQTQVSFDQSLPALNLNLLDPERGNTLLSGGPTGLIRFIGGGNPNLKPETSVAWSYGVVLTPRFIPGLRISADATDIRKRNAVIGTPSFQDLINNEDLFPGRITRGPNLPSDPVDWAGPIIGLDVTALNAFRTHVRAIDFKGDYQVQTKSAGIWQFYAGSTWSLLFRRQTVIGQPALNSIALSDGPLKWRGNLGLDWRSGNLGAGFNTQFYGRSSVCSTFDSAEACSRLKANQDSSFIPRQSYTDAYVRYHFGENSRFLKGAELSLGIQNLFNAEPPIVASSFGVSGLGDPRLRRFTIALAKRF